MSLSLKGSSRRADGRESSGAPCVDRQYFSFSYVFLSLYPCSASVVGTPWPKDKLVQFFRQLVITVGELHAINVSHEDIKRSNVLVRKDGSPVLVDFGFSHFKPNGGLVKSAGGTLDYSSPDKVAVSTRRV